jgi:hypothetical protein
VGRDLELEAPQHKEIVHTQLKALVPLEREVPRLEALGGLPRLEAIVLVEGHPGREPEAREKMHDAVDHRLRHGEDDTAAWAEECRTCRGGAPLPIVVHVLEDGEHRDRIEAFVSAQIVGEETAHEAHSTIFTLGREIRVDPDAARDTRLQDAEERAIRTTHVEYASAVRDMWRCFRDTPPLEYSVKGLH